MKVDASLNINYYVREIQNHAQNGNEAQAEKMYGEVLNLLSKNPQICPQHHEDIKALFAASLPPHTPDSEHITNFHNWIIDTYYPTHAATVVSCTNIRACLLDTEHSLSERIDMVSWIFANFCRSQS